MNALIADERKKYHQGAVLSARGVHGGCYFQWSRGFALGEAEKRLGMDKPGLCPESLKKHGRWRLISLPAIIF